MVHIRDLSVGVLSYGAHQTLSHSVRSHQQSGLDALSDDFFVYFNGRTEADTALANSFGVQSLGSPANSGIYGGFRAIVEAARHPYVLVLENDIRSVVSRTAMEDSLARCVADMRDRGIKAFSLRSRSKPGQGIGQAIDKYRRIYPIVDPIADLPKSRPTLISKTASALKYLETESFIGTSFFIERTPEAVHPHAIQRLASGNFITTSRYRKWSNQSVLVERQFFLDVICRRVDERPDPRLVNGHQDIERAIVGGIIGLRWWKSLDAPMGQAEDGCFCHDRLDRIGTDH